MPSNMPGIIGSREMKRLTVLLTPAVPGISHSLVYELGKRKRIRHERHSMGRGKILIHEDALEEYRQKQTVDVEKGAESPPPTLQDIGLG
jgi:hypothetical protein